MLRIDTAHKRRLAVVQEHYQFSDGRNLDSKPAKLRLKIDIHEMIFKWILCVQYNWILCVQEIKILFTTV